MRVYRFGIPFNSFRELAQVLELTAYTGKPVVFAAGRKAYRFLSEQDIINRMMKCSDAANENEAYDRFLQLVRRRFPERVDVVNRGMNDPEQSNTYKPASV